MKLLQLVLLMMLVVGPYIFSGIFWGCVALWVGTRQEEWWSFPVFLFAFVMMGAMVTISGIFLDVIQEGQKAERVRT